MKTILVTGASRGIGLAIAKVFAGHQSQFDNIVLVSRDEDALIAAKLEVNSVAGNKAVYTVTADLARKEAPKEIFDSIEALGLKVTTIINNAGYTAPAAVNDIKDADIDATFQINMIAPLRMVQEARARGHGLDFIVNVASTAGMTPRPGWTTYAMSKAAVIAMSECMREEFKPDGTEVLVISPGRCATDLRKTLAPTEDPSTIMQPEQVAGALEVLLSEVGRPLRYQNLIVRT